MVPPGVPLAQVALRWIIDQPGRERRDPGARNPEQATGNAAAAALPPLSREERAAVREIYDRLVRPHVHDRW